MAHTELDLRERRATENILYMEMSVSEIEGRRSTVYQEIKHKGIEEDELREQSLYYGVMTQRSTEPTALTN